MEVNDTEGSLWNFAKSTHWRSSDRSNCGKVIQTRGDIVGEQATVREASLVDTVEIYTVCGGDCVYQGLGEDNIVMTSGPVTSTTFLTRVTTDASLRPVSSTRETKWPISAGYIPSSQSVNLFLNTCCKIKVLLSV